MKSMTRILSLALAVILALSLCAVGAFADDAPPSGEPEDETTRSATPAPETATPTPEETAAPTATPATAPTAEPTAAPTEAPQDSPGTSPEVDPPTENEPYFEEPWGEGIFEGPNNPPEGSPSMMSIAAGTATIAVRGCYNSSGSVIKYVSSFYYDGRWVGGNGSSRHIIYANEEPAYCLEPGKYLVGGNTVTTNAATIWNGFSSAKRDAIKLAILCGAEGNASNLSGSYGSQYTATQMVIWEFVVGVRSTSSPYSLSDSKVINSVCSGGANSEVKTVYDQIVAAMQSYNTLPSFANPLAAPPPQQEMSYSGGKYTVTLTDSNGVLGNYNVTSTDGNVKVSVSGNKLTLTSSVAVSGATINLERKSAVSASSQITAYAAKDLQETIIGIEAVGGTPGYFGVYTTGGPTPTPAPTPTPKGNVKIVKTSDDGKVSGITFTVKGGSVNQTVTSGSDGTITIPGLTPGSYTVTETVPAGYTADRASQSVTVRNGETATVNFHNTRKTGSVKIIKTADDGKVSGIQFTVKGGSVNQTVTSGSDGTITVPGLVPGQYTVTETVPESYVCDNPSQTVTVEYDQTATVNFANKLKQWRVAVTKVDAEANVRRSSDVTLEGAQYGVYKDGTLQDTYTTDSSGHFTTNYYPCGSGWTLQEISAPTGYTVDPNSYPIGAEPGTVELAANDTAITVKERIIKGKLLIVKQDALTQTPLAGAVFSVMDETGATVTEATTGEDGTATVEELPYGAYTAKETKAPDGYQLDETVFDFAITEDGQTITLTRENIYCVGSISVHKVNLQGQDLSGAVYLLEWSEDGGTWNPVTFRDGATPTIGGCTTLGLENGQLTTGEDGTVLYDGLVANGKVQYRLTEIKAPAGMSLLKDPVYTGVLPAEGEAGPLYEVTFTVTDTRTTTLPQTGASGLVKLVTLGTALVGLAGAAGIFYIYNNKRRKHE